MSFGESVFYEAVIIVRLIILVLMKYFIFFLVSIVSCQFSSAQTLDRDLYLKLLHADSAQFIAHTKDLGYEVTVTPQLLFARSAAFRFEKPLLPARKIIWNTALVVSSKDKENNKVVYQKAKRSKNHKNSLLDKKYLYIESEMLNQQTGEIWYTVKILYRLDF